MKSEKYEELINRIIAVLEDLHEIEDIILGYNEEGDITFNIAFDIKSVMRTLYYDYKKLIEFY